MASKGYKKMKITKSQLRNIIKEELGRVLSEAISTPMPENYKSMGFFPDDIGGTSMPEIYAPPNYEQMMMKGQDFKVYLQDRKTKEFVNTRDGNFFTIDGQAVKRTGEREPMRALISVLRSQG